MSDQTPQDPQDDQLTPDEAAAEGLATPSTEAAEHPEAVTGQAEEPTVPPVAAEDAPAEDAPAEDAPAEDAPAEAPAEVVADAEEVEEELDEDPTPRVKPAIPGADLEVDIVVDGEDRPTGPWSEDDDLNGEGTAASDEDDEDVVDEQPIAAAIELAADARYRATGKRKTAIARVILKPGTGQYTINGRTMDDFFPRATLQRTIRQPLEAVGYEDRMDVVARMHGGGVSAQAGALRHGISRALLEADGNLRTELKRRGFLTRDARAKERKKAGLKKARKKPQFSKR
jgi:small subunit ribosomal protein S9